MEVFRLRFFKILVLCQLKITIDSSLTLLECLGYVMFYIYMYVYFIYMLYFTIETRDADVQGCCGQNSTYCFTQLFKVTGIP